MGQRAEFIVRGRVQGVGFRRSVKSIANDLGVRGTIQNLEDGTVKIIAESEKDVLDKFLRIIRCCEILGSKIVEDVAITYCAETRAFKNFEIIK